MRWCWRSSWSGYHDCGQLKLLVLVSMALMHRIGAGGKTGKMVAGEAGTRRPGPGSLETGLIQGDNTMNCWSRLRCCWRWSSDPCWAGKVAGPRHFGSTRNEQSVGRTLVPKGGKIDWYYSELQMAMQEENRCHRGLGCEASSRYFQELVF